MRITRKFFVRVLISIPLLLLGFNAAKAVMNFNYWRTRDYEWYLEEGIRLKTEGKFTEGYSNLKKAAELNPEGFRVNFEIGELLFFRNVLFGEDSAEVYLDRSLELSSGEFQNSLLQDKNISYVTQIDLAENSLEEALAVIDQYDDTENQRSSIFFEAKGRVFLQQADPSANRAGTFDPAAIAYEMASEKAEDQTEQNRLSLMVAYTNMPNNLAASQNIVEDLTEELSDDQTNSIFLDAVALRNIITDNALAGTGGSSFDDQLKIRILKNTQYGSFFIDRGHPSIALHFLNRSDSEISQVGDNFPVFVKGASAQSLALKGMAQLQLEQYTQAETSFRAAYNMQPFNLKYLHLTGLAQFNDEQSQRIDDALETFDIALNKGYLDEEFLEDYTDALLEADNRSKALEISEACYKANPANIDCLQNYTSLLIEKGDREQVQTVFSDIKTTFKEDQEVLDFFTAKLGLEYELIDQSEVEETLLAMEKSQSEFAQNVRVYTDFYLSRIYKDSNNQKYIEYLIKTVDNDFHGIFPSAQAELEDADLLDKKQDFWWWVDVLI